MRDIFEGLIKIHEKNFIHRDLKPENILLNIDYNNELGTQRFTAKIADFGLSAEYKFNFLSNR